MVSSGGKSTVLPRKDEPVTSDFGLCLVSLLKTSYEQDTVMHWHAVALLSLPKLYVF